MSLFLGNETKRLNRLMEKVEINLKEGSSDVKNIEDFIQLAKNYRASDPSSAKARYLVAKGNYYMIRFIGIISIPKLLEVAYADGMGGLKEKYPEMNGFAEEMYRQSMVAKAIDNRDDWTDNENLILLGETFRSVQKMETIGSELKKQKEPEGDLRYGFYWNAIAISLLTGDITYFDTIIKNEKLPFQLSQIESDFLKGYLYFNGKDYVRSLFLLRKAGMGDNEDIRFFANVIEAMIFFNQNLPGKGLEILEKLYKEWPARQNVIKKKFLEMKMKYPTLESSVISLTS